MKLEKELTLLSVNKFEENKKIKENNIDKKKSVRTKHNIL